MFMQIFFPLRLFALQGRHLSKVCSLGKSSEFCSLTFPIGKSFCLPFPWRKSGTNFCYCHRQFVITRQAACLRQEETLPQGPISGNFSPMIIGLNGSIFTPGKIAFSDYRPYFVNYHCIDNVKEVSSRFHDYCLTADVKSRGYRLPLSNLQFY